MAAGVSLWRSPGLTGVIPAEPRESRDRRVAVPMLQ